MDLQEHNRNCKSNDIELKKAKSACSEINNQIGGISNDLNKLKQEDQNDTPADIGALEDDEERYQVRFVCLNARFICHYSDVLA